MSPSLIANKFHLLTNIFVGKSCVVYFVLFGTVLHIPLFASLSSKHLKSPQYLPLEAQWCQPNGECIMLEVADKDYELRLGLMHRKTLANGTGMWFTFPTSKIVRFWMKETIIPLDMIFLNNGIVVAIEVNAQPCSGEPCSIYGPDFLVDSVIEIGSGEIKRLNIRVGNAIEITLKAAL